MASKATRRSGGRRTISVSEFKAQCLRLIEEVRTTGHEIVVTKHGQAVAVVSPVTKRTGRSYGRWKGLVEITGDIVRTDWSQEFEASRGG